MNTPQIAPDASQLALGAVTPDTTGSAADDSRENERGRPGAVFRCGGCIATWTAQGAAHCSGCHETFSGVTLFDRHRSVAGPRGGCHDPGYLTGRDGLELCEHRDGMWRFPPMDDEAKAARFGGDRDA